MVVYDNNHGIKEDILDKPGASAREKESCSLRSKVILQDCETYRVHDYMATKPQLVIIIYEL